MSFLPTIIENVHEEALSAGRNCNYRAVLNLTPPEFLEDCRNAFAKGELHADVLRQHVVELHCMRAYALVRLGRTNEVREPLESLLKICLDATLRGLVYVNLAMALAVSQVDSDVEDAEEMFITATSCFSTFDHDVELGIARLLAVEACLKQQHYRDARYTLTEALNVFKRCHRAGKYVPSMYKVLAHAELAALYGLLGNKRRSDRHARMAVELCHGDTLHGQQLDNILAALRDLPPGDRSMMRAELRQPPLYCLVG